MWAAVASPHLQGRPFEVRGNEGVPKAQVFVAAYPDPLKALPGLQLLPPTPQFLRLLALPGRLRRFPSTPPRDPLVVGIAVAPQVTVEEEEEEAAAAAEAEEVAVIQRREVAVVPVSCPWGRVIKARVPHRHCPWRLGQPSTPQNPMTPRNHLGFTRETQNSRSV